MKRDKGRLDVQPDPAQHYRARRCQVCGKGHAVTFHAWQQPDGRMVSVAAHLRCFRQLRAGTATIRHGRG